MGSRCVSWRMLCLLVLAFILPCCAVYQPADPARYKPQRVLFNGDVSVPLYSDGCPFLAPVKINGRGPFNFLVDSGCNCVAMTRETADALYLERKKINEIAVTPTGVLGNLEQVEIASMRLGNAEFAGVRANVIPIPAGKKDHPIHGIVGFALFWDIAWTLNAPAKQLILHADANRDFPGHAAPMTIENGIPVVPFRVRQQNPSHEKTGRTIIDTGGWDFFSLPAAWQNEIAGPFDPYNRLPKRGLMSVKQHQYTAGGEMDVYSYALRDTAGAIGEEELSASFFAFRHDLDALQCAEVGMVALLDYRITFNRPRGRMVLDKIASTTSPAEGNHPAPIFPLPKR